MDKLIFFSKDINIKYKKELEDLLEQAKKVPYERYQSKRDLQAAVNDLMQGFWRTFKSEFDRKRLKADSGEMTVRPDEFRVYTNQPLALIRDGFHKLYFASYSMGYAISSDAFSYGLPRKGVPVIGVNDKAGNTTIYFFTQNPLDDEEVSKIKILKEDFLDKIDEAMAENRTFYIQKNAEAQTKLQEFMSDEYDKVWKRININSKL